VKGDSLRRIQHPFHYPEVHPILQVREQSQHQKTVLTLTGRFCRKTTTGIRARILGAQEMGCHHIILDFSSVTEIDSTGLGELFLWYHNMRPYHVKISIVKPSLNIRNHLDWAHLSEIVPIYASEEEAVGHIKYFS
jgi:anti-anti-sigma factor